MVKYLVIGVLLALFGTAFYFYAINGFSTLGTIALIGVVVPLFLFR